MRLYRCFILGMIMTLLVGCTKSKNGAEKTVNFNAICAKAKADVDDDYEKGNVIWAESFGLDNIKVDFMERELNINYNILSGVSIYDSCYEYYSDSILYLVFKKRKELISIDIDSILNSRIRASKYQYYDGYYWYFDSLVRSGDSELFSEFVYSNLNLDSFKVKVSVDVDTNGLVSDCNVIRRYDSVSSSLMKQKLIGSNFKAKAYLHGRKVKVRYAPIYIMLKPLAH